MAFGTGTHPTTVLCIQALERYVKEGDSVVDVGTGTGILSIASAMLRAKQVEGYDLDPVAVESARLNSKLNKVSDHIEIKQIICSTASKGKKRRHRRQHPGRGHLALYGSGIQPVERRRLFHYFGNHSAEKTGSQRCTGERRLYDRRGSFNGGLGQHHR